MSNNNTKIFHIIPNSLRKKMRIIEKEDIYYLDYLNNNGIGNYLSFNVSNLQNIINKSNNYIKDFILLNNIIEEMWNKTEIENDVLNYFDSIKNQLKDKKKE